MMTLLPGGLSGLLHGSEADPAGHADAKGLALAWRGQLAVHQAVDDLFLVHDVSPFKFRLVSPAPSTSISDRRRRSRTPRRPFFAAGLVGSEAHELHQGVVKDVAGRRRRAGP